MDQVQRTHVGVVLLGAGQVVQVERVARVHVAADVAVAQVHAGALLDADGIRRALRLRLVVRVRRVVPEVVIEADREIERPEARAPAGARRPRPAAAACVPATGWWGPRHAQHAADLRVVRLQSGEGDLGRPSGVERVGLGIHRDVGVDERAAADAGPLHHASCAGRPAGRTSRWRWRASGRPTPRDRPAGGGTSPVPSVGPARAPARGRRPSASR